MTNFELSQIGLTFNMSFQNQIAIFISILFAYIVAAYLVGSKLNKFQLWSITTIYSLFSVLTLSALYNLGTGIVHTTYLAQGEDITFTANSAVAICVLAWILSIIFMVQIRRSAEN